MNTRELKRDEWISFFNAFSRRYRRQAITIGLTGPSSDEPEETVARHMPLVGIGVEREDAEAVITIKITVGDLSDEHMTHVVRAPSRIRVAQVTDGADELLLIDSATGPATRVDFHPLHPENLCGGMEMPAA